MKRPSLLLPPLALFWLVVALQLLPASTRSARMRRPPLAPS